MTESGTRPLAPPVTGRPVLYLGVMTLISVPFQGAAIATHGSPWVLGLPVSVAFILVPAGLATLFAIADQGTRGGAALWRSAIRLPGRPWAWLTAVLLPPVTLAVSLLLAQTLGHGPPRWETPAAAAPALLAVYLAGALLEEIGWSGYATAGLVGRWGVVRTGLAVGLAWAAVHWGSWFAMGRSATEVAALTVSTIVARLVMTWLFASGPGGVPLAVAMHAVSNTVQTYPDGLAGTDAVVWMAALLLTCSALLVAWALWPISRSGSCRRRWWADRPAGRPGP